MELIEENIQEEFSKDFYQPDYFSQFKINSRKRRVDIAAIIPTYNRCPFEKGSKDYQYNPLYLSIRCLLLQKAPIKEIIIIDDASTDHIKDVVEDLTKEAYATRGVTIKYLRNEQKMGSSTARNMGAKHASAKYLYFLDDDYLSPPYVTFISMIVVKKIEKIDRNFAVLALPVFNRASYPRDFISIDDLTRSFFKEGAQRAHFNAFPFEYIERKLFINKSLKIFKPIQVYQTWGHFIAERSKYLDVGGFPDFATWPNKVGEEVEFACRLVENIYTLYYLPDPKASAYHGLFGAKIGPFRGEDWLANITDNELSLVKFSDICENGVKSGNRVSTEDHFYSKIIAAFCILYKRNVKEAINWARESYEDFVVDQKPSWSIEYPQKPIPSRKAREQIWYRAISDGLQLLFQVEQEKLNKLEEFIESLKSKGKSKAERRRKGFFDHLLSLWD
ncbi:glycosyltransferase [Candidatus Parcubacteria bacterium]|nr:glycosyltransferase [Candidatus Parcubacteria bacterium]